MLTHFSLFTGIGGIDLASEWAGFTTVGQVEIDDYCRKVLEKHWPDVPKWGDIRDVTRESVSARGIGRIHLLSGGFPCQPHSCAGKRKASADERDLWGEFARVIREIEPVWVLAENVRGLLSSESGRFFGRVLRDLADMGYSVGWCCYGANAIGAPHQRERVFIVARMVNTDSAGLPGSGRGTEAEQDCNRQDYRLPVAASQDVAHADVLRLQEHGICEPGISKQPSQTMAHSPITQRQPGAEVEGALRAASTDQREHDNADGSGEERREDVAHSALKLPHRSRDTRPAGRGESADGGNMAYANEQGLERHRQQSGKAVKSRRISQSRLGSMVNEFSTRMDGGVDNGNAEETRSNKTLRVLRKTHGAQEVQWDAGKQSQFQPQEVLQPSMRGVGAYTREPVIRCDTQEVCSAKRGCMREMWSNGESGSSPQGRQPCQQRAIEPDDFMRLMSYEMALGEWEETVQEAICLHCLWQACKEVGYVPKALSEVQELWKSLSDQEKAWVAFRVSGRTDWPAGPGAQQHEWEPPRIAKGIKNRRERLKALGNAVVPAQVYPILQAIADIDRRC